jgi:hypothetical protein
VLPWLCLLRGSATWQSDAGELEPDTVPGGCRQEVAIVPLYAADFFSVVSIVGATRVVSLEDLIHRSL